MLLQTEMAALGLGHHQIAQWELRSLANALQEALYLKIVWLDDSAL